MMLHELISLDRNSVENMYVILGENSEYKFIKILKIYIEESFYLFNNIILSVGKKDFKSISRSSHALCSISSSIAAIDFSKLCYRIEKFSYQKNLNKVNSEVLIASLQYNKLILEIENFIKSYEDSLRKIKT